MTVVLLPISLLRLHRETHNLRHDAEASICGQAALSAAEPSALIISTGDRSTFSLWHLRHALGLRPDIAVVDASLWGFDWYRRTISQYHPQLLVGLGAMVELPDLIDHNLSQRPLYLTSSEIDLAALPSEPAGPLLRILQAPGSGGP